MFKTFKIAALPAFLVLAGCSVSDDGLWPSTADHAATPDGPTQMGTASPAALGWDEPVAPVDALELDLPATRDAVDTGTFAGEKTLALQSDLNLLITMVTAQNDELRALRGGAAQNGQRFTSSVRAIQSQLNAGTAPGNPELMARVDTAQTALDQVTMTQPRLTDLSTRVTGNENLAAYIADSANAAIGVQDANEADQQQLAAIIDDTARVKLASTRLLGEIDATMARHRTMATRDKTTLSGLAMAVRNGNAYTATRSWMATTTDAPALIAIAFNRSDADYEGALRDAISATLDRQPDARFELIAVMPQRGGSGDAAKRSAARVLRSLIAMGLPTDRVILVSETSDLVSEGEVQLYVR